MDARARNGSHAVGGGLAPFGRGIDLPAQVCTGVQRVERTGLRLEIVESAGATRLIATGTSNRATGADAFAVDLEVAKPPGHESLNVVIPWSDRRFQFTSKQNTRPTTGEVRWGGRRWQVGADEVAYAVQDLGRGVWPYANRWNWAAASGTGQDGRVVGLQLGGKWTEGTGCTENALCLDGRVTKIHDELEWTYDWDEPLRPWRVRSPGTDQVDVVLTPTFDRYDLTDLAVVRLEVHQCFGTWSGTVTGDDGVPVRIDGIDGFAEEARNRW